MRCNRGEFNIRGVQCAERLTFCSYEKITKGKARMCDGLTHTQKKIKADLLTFRDFENRAQKIK